MLQFFEKVAQLWKDIFTCFDEHPIMIGDIPVSLSALLFAFFIVGFFVSFYWKGART